MRKLQKIGLVTVLALSSIVVLAQDAGERRGPGGPGGPGGAGGQGGPGGPGGGRPQPPIINALDANKDGKLDATEIANATAALKALDKNKDGELTGDEMFGPRPAGRRPGGPGGPGGPGSPGAPGGAGGAGGAGGGSRPPSQ